MTGIALDPLIAEAKERARRRRLYLLAILGILAAGALTYDLLPSGGPAVAGKSGSPSDTSTVRLRGVGEVGSSGGVTWAMNGHGLWLTTTGGHVWRKVTFPQGTGFIETQGSSVQFVDPQHGWISINELTGYPPHRGGRWVLARTTDGGRTWQTSEPSCRCGGGSMDFLDARHGFLLAYTPRPGAPNALFRTDDGGRTWQPVARAEIQGPITFLDERIGFAFGWSGAGMIGPYSGPSIGTLYRTTDGGRTWSRYDIGGSTSFVEQPVRVVGHHVVVVQNGRNPAGGLNLAAGTIYVSADGRHWHGSAVPGQPVEATAFTAVSPNVWVFASGSRVYMTGDAGRHWRKTSIHARATRFPQRLWVARVDFTSRQSGWAVLNRKLYRTTDGGLRWTVAGPPKGTPIPVHACDPAKLSIAFWSSGSRLRHVTADLSFGNTGRLGCRLSGWPTVVAVEADGTTVRAKRISSGRPLVIGPGHSALVEVEGASVRPGNTSACPKAVFLRVTLPGTHTAKTLAGPWNKGSGHTFYFPLCGRISVTPFFRH